MADSLAHAETGRAGRDGLASRCLLYYSAEDKARVTSLVAKSMSTRQRLHDQHNHGPDPSQRAPDSMAALIQFAESASVCRHVSICRYFGEKVAAQDVPKYCKRFCDVCKNGDKVRRERDEGLKELDFPATQAVLKKARPLEEVEDPWQDERGGWDYEPDRTQAPGKGGEMEQINEEEDCGAEPTLVGLNKMREGFRTASSQRRRDADKAARALEPVPESSPLPELPGDYSTAEVVLGGDEPPVDLSSAHVAEADDDAISLSELDPARPPSGQQTVTEPDTPDPAAPMEIDSSTAEDEEAFEEPIEAIAVDSSDSEEERVVKKSRPSVPLFIDSDSDNEDLPARIVFKPNPKPVVANDKQGASSRMCSSTHAILLVE